jgi:hypothetical protein
VYYSYVEIEYVATSFSLARADLALKLLMKHAKIPMNFEHYVNPMVHPVTGCTIKSYTKLTHDPAMAEIWQTTFGKDFGGMAQGCNKTGKKGTNTMFVMMHDEIRHALAAIFFT